MRTPFDVDEAAGASYVSTGHLPPAERVDTLLAEAYERFKSVDEGKVADYIPALARAPRGLFGLCVAETNGAVHAAGDTEYEFSIQSVSKPFVFALICHAVGEEEARKKLGVNATGLPFNSVMAIELNSDRTMNPMVNAGAIATTSLAPGATADAKWKFIQDGLSRFAGAS
jgi:glutaminase